jgi:hypothetical protein
LKSPAFAPESVTLLIVIDAVLLFVRVMVFCAPMPPTGTATQLSVVGEGVTAALQSTAPKVLITKNIGAATLHARNRNSRTAVLRLRIPIQLWVREW